MSISTSDDFAQCELDSSYQYFWSQNSSQETLYRKTYYTYNTAEQCINMLVRTLDNGSLLWTNSYQNIYTYNAAGNKSTLTNQTWDFNNSTWHFTYLDTFIYNPIGKLTLIINRTYQPVMQTTYLYNTIGNMTNSISQLLSSSSPVNYEQNTYTYDATGNPTSAVTQTWNNSNSTWINLQKQTNTYTGTKLIGGTMQFWNSTTLAWNSPVTQFVYSYDSMGNQTNVLFQTWDSNASTFTNNNRTDYFYSCTTNTTGIQEYNKNAFESVYPNPARDVLNIKLQSEAAIEIYSVTGQLLIKSEASKIHRVNVSALPSGIYFIRDKNGASAKFVKE